LPAVHLSGSMTSTPTATEWIATSETKPPYRTKVLMIVDGRHSTLGTLIESRHGNHYWRGSSGSIDFLRVKAWAPIPPKPPWLTPDPEPDPNNTHIEKCRRRTHAYRMSPHAQEVYAGIAKRRQA
jgi:hypothetical protein